MKPTGNLLAAARGRNRNRNRGKDRDKEREYFLGKVQKTGTSRVQT